MIAQRREKGLMNKLTFGLAMSDLVCTLNFTFLPYYDFREQSDHDCTTTGKGLMNKLTFGLAMSDLVCTLNFTFLPFWIIPQYVVTYFECMCGMIVLICGLNSSTVLTLLVGVERLLILIRPGWRSMLTSNWMYGFYTAAFIVPYAIFIGSSGFIYASHVKVVACSPPFALTGTAMLFWNRCTLTANVLVLITYMLLVVAFNRHFRRVQGVGNSASWNEEHLIKSSILVAVVYLVTWTTTMTMFFAVTTFNATEETFAYVAIAGGLFAVTNNTSNALIYYNRSEDYRRAFRNILGIAYHPKVTGPVTIQPTEAKTSPGLSPADVAQHVVNAPIATQVNVGEGEDGKSLGGIYVGAGAP